MFGVDEPDLNMDSRPFEEVCDVFSPEPALLCSAKEGDRPDLLGEDSVGVEFLLGVPGYVLIFRSGFFCFRLKCKTALSS